MDLNRAQLIGRTTDDTDKKVIESSGTSVINFVVATNRKYTNKEGNVMEEAEYHRCVAYGNSADILDQYLHKGKRIYVEGRLRTRKRQDSSGTTKYTTEIIVTHFIFLDSLKNKNADNIDTESDADIENLPF